MSNSIPGIAVFRNWSRLNLEQFIEFHYEVVRPLDTRLILNEMVSPILLRLGVPIEDLEHPQMHLRKDLFEGYLAVRESLVNLTEDRPHLFDILRNTLDDGKPRVVGVYHEADYALYRKLGWATLEIDHNHESDMILTAPGERPYKFKMVEGAEEDTVKRAFIIAKILTPKPIEENRQLVIVVDGRRGSGVTAVANHLRGFAGSRHNGGLAWYVIERETLEGPNVLRVWVSRPGIASYVVGDNGAGREFHFSVVNNGSLSDLSGIMGKLGFDIMDGKRANHYVAKR
jgi:hypothetical protein